MYFSVEGQVSPCWLYYPSTPPVWSTERSIADIWKGPEFTKVRKALREGRFIGRCKECRHDIANGVRPLAAAYDSEHPIGDWPTMLELELSNVCNLECVMCSGLLSSRIRKNRDHLPPLESPYDDSFVDQVAELLPGLQEIRFNGGEPLLQPIVYAITDRIAEVRPDLKVTIATNGTVMTPKVRRLLERCNIHVNLSIDSLVPERYAEIRINADLPEVLANFEVFRQYCQDRDRSLCVMVNPMRVNWMEMADYVHFANGKDVHLHYNTIRHPEHLALHNLSVDELTRIHDTLAAESLPEPHGPHAGIHRYNLGEFQNVLNQTAAWRDEAAGNPPGLEGVPVELGRRS
jgi:MoaA/NifB/PqqE/SkfB family radical SAM enzyme